MSASVADDLREQLRAALREALRARNTVSVSALRSMIAVIDNAEAVDVATEVGGTSSEDIAGAVVGLGAGDVARRRLTPADLSTLIRGEIDERHAVASQYEATGHPDRAARLRAEAGALEPFTE